MTIRITAACLLSLKSLLTALLTALSNLIPLRRNSDTSNPHSTHHAPQPNAHSDHSHNAFLTLPTFNHTFIPPKHAYLRRFHDHESCLDFDLETPPPRTQTHSQMHSRTTSDVTNFSVPFDRTATGEMPISKSRKGSRGLVDMDEEVRVWRSGYAVSVTSGDGQEEDDRMVRTVRTVASDDESVMRWGEPVAEEGCGGIMRTTTMEITII
jgi:hypothetical protein